VPFAFFKIFWGRAPDLPPVGFAPSALAGDWLRRPVLSGKHARAHQKSISSRTPMSPNILAAHLTTLRYTDCDSHIIRCGERSPAGRSVAGQAGAAKLQVSSSACLFASFYAHAFRRVSCRNNEPRRPCSTLSAFLSLSLSSSQFLDTARRR